MKRVVDPHLLAYNDTWDKVDAMLADIEAHLLPFSRDGVLTETVVATADIARRL